MKWSVNIFSILFMGFIYDGAIARSPPRPSPPLPGFNLLKYNCSAPRVFPYSPAGVVCTSTHPSFFYNETVQQCQDAGDIGCGRTQNNFPDLQSCEKHCLKIKELIRYDCSAARVLENQPEGIVCSSTHPSYFFNSTAQECQDAGDIGCGRTENNFPDMETCEKYCLAPTDNDPSHTSPPRPRPPGRVNRAQYDCSAARVLENQPEGIVCSSTHPSYFFNSTAQECQDAGDIGCGRTENNFPDMETCEKYCLAPTECNTHLCPWYLWKHYTERACQPIYEPGLCCPVQFDCPPTEWNTTHCIHRGQMYESGSDIDVENVCQKCRCFPAFADRDYATIECATIECPEVFGFRPKPGCSFVEEPGKCCRVQKCDTEVKMEEEKQIDTEVKMEEEKQIETMCKNDEKIYQEGETMEYPDRPCHRCVCNRDYNGTDGPGCYDIHCSLDTSFYNIKKGCTPKYIQDSCCVIDWVCHPEDTKWQTYNEICQLPLDTGLSSCVSFATRYYYDSHLGRCQSFNYTGCLGNMNNFKNLKHCESLCEKPEICGLPPVTDDCSEQATKYYFDVKTGDCKPFPYGGCDANGNIFDSTEECMLKCGLQVQDRTNTQIQVCQMEADKGPCDEEVIRYAFNPQSNQCEPFTYGNCKGNGNNFESEEVCSSYCQVKSTEELTCRFGPYQFPVGHQMKQHDICLNCTCVTPPLFTCVKKRCYPPTDQDYLFCNVEDVAGECCPKYNCFKTMDEVCEYFKSCNPNEECSLKGSREDCLRGFCSISCVEKTEDKTESPD